MLGRKSEGVPYSPPRVPFPTKGRTCSGTPRQATRANATTQAEAEKADAEIAQRADPQRGSRRLFSTATRASAITKLTNQDLLREQQRQQTSKAP